MTIVVCLLGILELHYLHSFIQIALPNTTVSFLVGKKSSLKPVPVESGVASRRVTRSSGKLPGPTKKAGRCHS